MTARAITKVSAKFGSGDFRNIKFTGDPKVNEVVSIRVHGMPGIKMQKDHTAGMWVATCSGRKGSTSAPVARRAYQNAIAKFWG